MMILYIYIIMCLTYLNSLILRFVKDFKNSIISGAGTFVKPVLPQATV